MPTTDEDRNLEVLTEAECLALLGTARTGRLAFTRRALPAIELVSVRLLDGRLVIPARPDSEFLPGAGGVVVALEVDGYDEAERTGWRVTVVGAARRVLDPDEVRLCEALGWCHPLRPDRQFLTVLVGPIRGWRSVPRPTVHPPGPA